jgi:hypothetical protein
MKDLFGKAILDYQTNNAPEDLITETSISEADEMSVAYLFRSYEEMPAIEQTALQMAKGKTLDVGCGAGSHSLYLQHDKQLDVNEIPSLLYNWITKNIGANSFERSNSLKDSIIPPLFIVFTF